MIKRLFFAGLLAGASISQARTYQTLIFIDTSGSIREEQFNRAKDHLRTIFKQTKGDLRIYPINTNTGSPDPVYDDIGFYHADEDQQDQLVQEFQTALDELTKMHEKSSPSGKVNVNRASSHTGPLESCILESLEFVSQGAEQQRNKWFRVIYLSDMIEECESTPAHERIVLQWKDSRSGNSTAQSEVIRKERFAKVSKAIEKIRPHPDGLKNCEISVVLPGNVDDAAMDDLTELWRKIFKVYGYPSAESLILQRNTLIMQLH